MDSKLKKKPNAGSLFLSLFGLPFLAVGLFVLWLATSTFTESRSMRAWPTVPALIEEAQLEEHESRDHDSTTITYKVSARYTYDYQGASYTGTRVTISSAADSSRSFHQEVFDELNRHRQEKTPFRTYVNPASPQESILYPQYRIGVLLGFTAFGLLFTTIGSFLVFSPLFKRKAASQHSHRFLDTPLKPWEEREEWRTGVIHSSAKGMFVAFGVFALLWLAGSSPATLATIEGLESGNLFSLVWALFPLIGVALLAASIHMFLRWRKFGVSTLRLTSVPAQPGGSLEGEIEVRVPLIHGTAIQFELACNKQYTTGSGKNSRTETKKLWSTQWQTPSRPIGGRRGARIPVSCRIPEDAMETCQYSKISWELTTTAPLSGIDFVATFEVPVFHTDTDHADEEETEDANFQRPESP